jgi:hypothetical protein
VKLIALLVLIAMVFVGLLAWRRRSAASLGTPDEVQQGMQELAPLAVEDAKSKRHLALDYSPGSIEIAEAALGQIHDEVSAGRMSPEDGQTLAVRYGAYVGETIRRKWGGQWARDHQVAGLGSFPLRVGKHEVFPIAWCAKRVKNGPEDNIWHKYLLTIAKPAA